MKLTIVWSPKASAMPEKNADAREQLKLNSFYDSNYYFIPRIKNPIIYEIQTIMILLE